MKKAGAFIIVGTIAMILLQGCMTGGSHGTTNTNTKTRGGTHMGEVAEVSQATFEDEVVKSDLPTLVDFWAPWCGPCRMLSPTVEELAGEYTGKLKVVKVNTDQNNEVAGQFGIRGIPTLIFFKNGKEVDRLVGAQQKAVLAKKIDEVIADGK
jgi:thioredoxin 1